MAEAKKMVDSKIAGKKVMMFSKSWCSYCTKAKNAIKKHLGKELDPDDYEVLEIENLDNGDAIQDYLRNLTGARSVPRVFIGGKCIGGGDETAAFERNGKLGSMIAAA